MTYRAPSITDLGSVRSLTQSGFDKVGSSTDAASQVIPGLDGSIINDPAV